MTKTIKLSLAAVALAGFTSAAFAAPTVSGSIAHQFQKKDTEDLYTTNTKVSLKTTGAVNDNLSYVVSYAARTSSVTERAAGDLGLSNAKFTYKNDMGTFVLGRQGVTTPWTNGGSLIDSTTVSNGVLAIIPAGAVTVVAGNMINHSGNLNQTGTLLTKDSDITVLGALGKAGGANLEAWYVSVAEDEAATTEGLTGITLAASGNVADVSLKARYSSVSPETAAVKDQSLMSLEGKTKVGNVGINFGFAKGGEDGHLVALDAAGNAANQIYAGTWNLSVGGATDSNVQLVGLGASMPLTDTLTASANYGMWSADGADDKNEIKLQLSAKVAKNFSLYARYAQVSSDDASKEFDRTRVYAAYKF
jgi:hypothetical protein